MTLVEEFDLDVYEIVTETFGIEGEVIGEEYWFACVDPDHDDRNPSAHVHLVTGGWHCFSCGAGGSILDLGSKALSTPRKDVRAMLASEDAEARLAVLQRRLRGLRRASRRGRAAPSGTVKIPPRGSYEDEPLTYMYERGYTEETLERFGVRWCPEETLEFKKGPAKITNSVAIPVENRCWAYRRTDESREWQPKFLYTPGIPLRDIWFGLSLVPKRERAVSEIVVVEGPLDAMWISQCGFNAVAMLGTHNITEQKARELEQFRSVVIFGDRDTAGLIAVRKLGGWLYRRTPVRIATYGSYMHDAGDPAEIAPVDVELAIDRAKPWTAWAWQN